MGGQIYYTVCPWLAAECIEYRKEDSVLRSVEEEELDEFTRGLFFKKIIGFKTCINNSNNLEATFVKLSETIQYFITEIIDVLEQFAESYCFVTVAVKRTKKSFSY